LIATCDESTPPRAMVLAANPHAVSSNAAIKPACKKPEY
jgi:hypothetical protein